MSKQEPGTKNRVSDEDIEQKKALLIEALSYIGQYQGRIVVIKYGGAAQINDDLKRAFAHDVVLLRSLGMLPVVVHGGGPEISRTLTALGLETTFVGGLRVTTAETLKVTEMVLSGQVNKEVVALFNASGGKAVGISGKDGALIQAKKLVRDDGVDLGFVGEIEHIDATLIEVLLEKGMIPVVSPIGMGLDGTTYNINADSAASRIAAALKSEKMISMTDVDGVMDEGQLVSSLTSQEALKLISDGVIHGGMVPKVEAMLYCLNHGVGAAQIINGSDRHALIAELFTDRGIGTKITG